MNGNGERIGTNEMSSRTFSYDGSKKNLALDFIRTYSFPIRIYSCITNECMLCEPNAFQFV